MSAAARPSSFYLAGLDTRFVTIVRSRSAPPENISPGCTIVEDVDGALTGWFEGRPGVAVVRPDRYLAALTTAEGLDDVVGRLRAMLDRSA
jgi:3-(3-hydroxy-phenyl)propionate hydroxylase